MDELNLATLPKYLSDEAEAWALLERLRWPDGEPVCPHCGTKDAAHYFLKAKSGTRSTRTGNVSFRRIWKCRDSECRRQFSVLVGTVFESSKVPISKWLLAIWLMGAGKNSVSALEMRRHLGIAYQTAWFMAHRLRESMRRDPLADLLPGTVVVDETFVGGRAGAAADKVPVVALISKETGETRTRIVADVTGSSLREALDRDLDIPATTLHTDGHLGYRAIALDLLGHERSVDGAFHNVSRGHLHRYADEFAYTRPVH